MGIVIDGSIEWLKDESTGDVVGYKRKDGAERGVVTAETNPVTGGVGFNGKIIDMAVTPNDTNTAAYPVGTLFISPSA